MTTTATTPQIAELILVRLLAAGKNPRPAAFREQLSTFRREPIVTAEWKREIDDLAAADLVTGKPLGLTDAGRRRALEFLGITSLPEGTKWATLVSRYLVPLALGVPSSAVETRKRVAEAEGLGAFVMQARHGLPAGAGATLARALEMLACKELGFPDTVSMNDVKRRVLSRLAGSEEPLNNDMLRKQLLREASGAARTGTQEIRKAILRRWFSGNEEITGATHLSVQVPETRVLDLSEFAATIKAVARDCPTGWFGDRKVFINHVWRHFRSQDGVPALDLPAFKAKLVLANQARLLDMSRADLPDQLPADDLRESETHQENAVFHFIQAERSRP